MRASDAPPTVDARRDAVVDRLADAPGVLCCLDFDGTLAPIVEDPDEATMDAACRSVVGALASRPSVEVAVVSGRAVDDLRERVGVDDVTYAGNHGLELHRGEEIEVLPEADGQRRALDDVCAEIEARTESIPGCVVEHKGVTATVHYRQVAEDRVDDVVEAVESVVRDADDAFEALGGKQIVEIRPRVAWDKGRVVDLLDEETPDGWETVYVGDDVTDEDAFEVVEPAGLGVLVGDDPDTAASVRIPDRADVPDFLELVDELQRSDGE